MQELWEQPEDLQTAGSPQTRVWTSTRECRILRGTLCLFYPGDLWLHLNTTPPLLTDTSMLLGQT